MSPWGVALLFGYHAQGDVASRAQEFSFLSSQRISYYYSISASTVCEIFALPPLLPCPYVGLASFIVLPTSRTCIELLKRETCVLVLITDMRERRPAGLVCESCYR